MKWKKIYSLIEKVMISLCVLSLLGFVLHVFMKVRDGHGLDYYTLGMGYQLNYIGVLILFILMPVALGGGWILGKFLTWYDTIAEKRRIEERRLKWEKRKKFNKKKKRRRNQLPQKHNQYRN